jgi:hypothetical protein
VQGFACPVQRLVPELLEGIGDAFGERRELLTRYVSQASAELGPPVIQVVVDRVGRATTQAHPYTVDRGPVSLHQELIGRAKDIGLGVSNANE